ncbi:uncharacterized protein HMPREF1541_10913 [Cyphellophora europaea CBS 101466]|uniref:FAD/NAD(P)-binding domain-containing protein n=1 Tax=Cyphellophora europaea (strain CBS 101466) TaxID=1220924 RepID=W2S7M5_CYPE1|nr:uncharacterized protein HMPREF1541_10913 [Cyphellophora europaea CBS 101466]ETN44048.1 hypothetical protein HMPREF1541_10913 [Cyphellophora europaea CBS 101466]
MSLYDLVVVGAGPSGLIAAHTWLTVQPQSKVIIFEAGRFIGGTWSKDRIYPTMMTQTPLGMFEYSSYPMDQPKTTFNELFSGEHTCQYLSDFSRSVQFAGETIHDRIDFDSRVTKIWKSNHLWTIETSKEQTVRGRKMILATGLTSTPKMPPFLQQNTSVPIFHSRDLAVASPILSSSFVRDVIVIGGSKSAFDAVYLLSKLGKRVSWIIRPGGHGPGMLASSGGAGPFKSSHDLISLKLISKMSPCVFEESDGWTKFFHQSLVGSWLVKAIWHLVDKIWQANASYQRDENFAQLRPDRPAYWCSDNLGVQNTPDLWDTLSKATVVRGEIIRIETTRLS